VPEHATGILFEDPKPYSEVVVRRADIADEFVVIDAPRFVEENEPRYVRDDP